MGVGRITVRGLTEYKVHSRISSKTDQSEVQTCLGSNCFLSNRSINAMENFHIGKKFENSIGKEPNDQPWPVIDTGHNKFMQFIH